MRNIPAYVVALRRCRRTPARRILPGFATHTTSTTTTTTTTHHQQVWRASNLGRHRVKW